MVKSLLDNPLPQNFRLVQIQTNCRRHFKVHVKWKISTIRVENIVRKGEIACDKQCLLFSQCFPQLNISSVSKCGIVWYWDNKILYRSKSRAFANNNLKVSQLTHSHTMTPFDAPGKQAF